MLHQQTFDLKNFTKGKIASRITELEADFDC